MDIVQCKIALGGDYGQVVVRSGISWPEISVLQQIHGEDAVHDIERQESVETPRPMAEKNRLLLRYGAPYVEATFPGRAPAMEMDMPGAPPPPKSKPKVPARKDED